MLFVACEVGCDELRRMQENRWNLEGSGCEGGIGNLQSIRRPNYCLPLNNSRNRLKNFKR
jgi:hypothetical protein